MYPPKFDYYRASSVDNALALLQEHQGAKVLAGGHSLLPLMKIRLADPGTIIDIGRIGELKGITTEGNVARIGALTTHATIEKSRVLPQALTEAAANIGDPAVRNRGTIGGNVAHADPASDLPTVLLALGARMIVTGARAGNNGAAGNGGGERVTWEVEAADFFTGFFSTALAEDELLLAVEVPTRQTGTGTAYAKLSNPASRYAMLGVAAAITLSGGVCTEASVCFGGLVPSATKAPSVEAALVGKALNEQTIAAAAAAIDADLGDQVMGDVHAGAEYRRSVAPVYAERAIQSAASRAG